MTKKEIKQELKLIEKGLKNFPKVLAQKERAFKHKKKMMKAFAPVSKELYRTENKKITIAPIHPWRLCPLGKFYRGKHKQSSYVRSNGVVVSGSIHPNECVVNKTGKDQIYSEELQEIAARHFPQLSGLPAANDLKYPNGNKFDSLIRGWTKYWNEILNPKEPLDPDLVKALIATESGFDPDPKKPKKDILKARGLMQVTNQSRKLLAGAGSDLKDHFVHVDLDDMTDPNLNIACGIRWLFRKKEIVDSRNKTATWIDGVMAYKSYSSLNEPQMKVFLDRYTTLKRTK